MARYKVDVSVGDSAAPVARLSEIQEVRIRTFRETARREESVVFQGFLTLAPGEYPANVRVSDVGSGAGFSADIELHVPRFATPSVTAPIVVYQAQPREIRGVPPAFIVSPRATIELDRQDSHIYVESLSEEGHSVVLEAQDGGRVIWSDTLAAEPMQGPLNSVTAAMDAARLPPGALTLHARLAGCVECLACNATCPSYDFGRNPLAGPYVWVKLMQLHLDPRNTIDRRRQAQDLGVDRCADCRSCHCLHGINIRRDVVGALRGREG